jgi:hypothetical protein
MTDIGGKILPNAGGIQKNLHFCETNFPLSLDGIRGDRI